MANSKASKKRRQTIREGRRDPKLDRLGWNGLSPVERKAPTLAERMAKQEKKHRHQLRWNPIDRNDSGGRGSIYFSIAAG